MRPSRIDFVTLAGYILALIFTVTSIVFYARSLFIKSRLDEMHLEYESLLSEKLQLEKSYYRLKEERIIESAAGSKGSDTNQFDNALKAMKQRQEEEVAKLYKKIEELHQQIIRYQKIN